ncbi:hypothetical protein [Halomonas huangheensis]|nr:hypothetical protein [Halomonas huangheensis]
MKKVLHVGQMKSGTTYVQNVLFENRKALKKEGWLYPGKLMNQQHACYGLCGTDIYWADNEKKWRDLGREMLDEIEYHDGDIVISSEALSSLSRDGAAKFIDEIGGVDAVVVTVRSLFTTLPSAWQQYIKGGGVVSIADFFDRLDKNREDGSGMWRTYSYGKTVKIWSEFSPVKVVVIPENPTSKNQLWEDFSGVVGLPDLSDVVVNDSRSNVSLNYEAAEILRSINVEVERCKPRVSKKEVEQFRRNYLNRYIFPIAGNKRGTKTKIPEDYKRLVSQWNDQEKELLLSSADDIVGDVKDLVCYEGGELSLCHGGGGEFLSEIACQIVGGYKWKN